MEVYSPIPDAQLHATAELKDIYSAIPDAYFDGSIFASQGKEESDQKPAGAQETAYSAFERLPPSVDNYSQLPAQPTVKSPAKTAYTDEYGADFSPKDDPYAASGSESYGYNSSDTYTTSSSSANSDTYVSNEKPASQSEEGGATNYTRLAASSDSMGKQDPTDKTALKKSKSLIPVPSYKQKDWNKEFQEILKREETEEKYLALSHLASEFVFVAETYGKVIISELSIPDSDKSIKPVGMGGIAGGSKYIAQGILFKFALDIGGIYSGDENAQKAASHELKGLSHYWLTGVEGLHFPLMCLIHYCGFCLIAMSILPITKDSLMYGSSDGGKNVHFDEPDLTKKMEEAGKKMNLKGHFAGLNMAHQIYGPGDIEGHKGTDNCYYVVDFARVFPPEAMLPGDPLEPGRILYKLLRPELVLRSTVALSSDALTGWGKKDPDSKKHNLEVQECTKHLLLKVIPSFVAKMFDDFSKTTLPGFITEMHLEGINVRHLGLIRNLILLTGTVKQDKARAKFIGDLLLVEMIARVVKNWLKMEWRGIVRAHYHINQDLCRQQAVTQLNRLLNDSTESKDFWNVTLKQQLVRKFKGALTAEELAPDFDLHAAVTVDERIQIVDRILDLAGIELTRRASHDFHGNKSSNFQFLVFDIAQLKPSIKHMQVVDFANMQALFLGGVKADNPSTADRYFSLALDTLKASPHISLMGAERLLQYGQTLAKRAKGSTQTQTKEQQLVPLAQNLMQTAGRLRPALRLEVSINVAKLASYCGSDWGQVTKSLDYAIAEEPDNYLPYMVKGKLAFRAYNYQISVDAYTEVLRLQPELPKALVCYGNATLCAYKSDDLLSAVDKTVEVYTKALAKDPGSARYFRTPWTKYQGYLVAILAVASKVPQFIPSVRKYLAELKKFTIANQPQVTSESLNMLGPVALGLEEIALDGCINVSAAGFAGIIHLAEATLTTLIVPRNPEGVTPAVLEAAAKCAKLESLNISGCTALTLESILALFKQAQNLKRLSASNLPALTEEGLKQIVQSPNGSALTALWLGKSGCTAASVPTILTLQNLTELSFRGSKVPFAEVEPVFQLPQLLMVDFYACDFALDNKATLSQNFAKISHPTLEQVILPNGFQFLYSGSHEGHIMWHTGTWATGRNLKCVFGVPASSKVQQAEMTVYASHAPGETCYFVLHHNIRHEGEANCRLSMRFQDLTTIRHTTVSTDYLVLAQATTMTPSKTFEVKLLNSPQLAFKATFMHAQIHAPTFFGANFNFTHQSLKIVAPPKSNLTLLAIAAWIVSSEHRRVRN